MAVKGNDSTEKTVREKALYTGLADCKIIAINPTMIELQELGLNYDKEPQYISEKESIKKVRLDFWVQTEVEDPNPVISKVSLWVEDCNFVGRTSGKTQFINKYGKTGWGMSSDDCGQYFLTDGARESFKGEEEVHKLLTAYLNTKFDTKNKQYDECLLDNPSALFDGNYTELKNIIKTYKDNTVRLMFGVDANGYQNIYNKYFEKTCINPNYVNWKKALNGEYTQFKADWQNNFDFNIYTKAPQDASVISPDAEKVTEDQF